MPNRPEVISTIERAERDDVEGLARLGVATVHEANCRTGLMHGIRPVTGSVRAGGTAITCLNFAGDNLMLHAAVEVAEPGDMLVVGVTSPSRHGMFGELLATSCAAHGITGVVLDAGARDVNDLRTMSYPVWSRCVSAAGTTKSLPGWVNIPISCGGVIVSPGDVVVADDDGVVVVGRQDSAAVLADALRRHEREIHLRARLQAGELSLDTGNLRQIIESRVSRKP